MITKIVYVVSSSGDDIYLEQTWISAYSTRKKMPKARIVLVVDPATDKTITNVRSGILGLIDEKTVVDVPEKYNKVQASRYMKTSLRDIVEGDFLFVDSDTIITENLSDIDFFEGDIGMVKDVHGMTPQEEVRTFRKLKKLGLEGNNMVPYYNSGVIFARDNDSVHTFYHNWHKCWKQSIERVHKHYDQPPLAVANQQLDFPIKELDGIWNCQIMNNGLPFLYKAKIIHYIAHANRAAYRRKADKPYLFYDQSIFQSIKDTGKISSEVSEMIDYAKGAFVTPCGIVVGNELDLITNSLHFTALYHPRIYQFFNLLAGWINTSYRNIGSLLRKLFSFSC